MRLPISGRKPSGQMARTVRSSFARRKKPGALALAPPDPPNE
jgi:hypothetical protein